MFRATGFSLFFLLLVAYHLKDLEDLHDNYGAASAALTIVGGRNAVAIGNGHGLLSNCSHDQGVSH
jgi:hypothetical protein